MIRAAGSVLSGALFLTACGEEGEVGSCQYLDATSIAPYEGIYQFTEVAINTSGCDAPGPSVLGTESEPFFYLAERSGFGIAPPSLALTTCADVANCREKLMRQNDVIGPPSNRLLSFSCQEGPNRVSAQMAWTGFGRDGICTDGHVDESSLEKNADGSVHIEVRITRADDHPEDSEGFCTTDGSQRAASGNPCSEYQVLEGVFLEPL